MKIYSHEEALDEVIGQKGTNNRDSYDEKVKMLLIGEAIRKSRIERQLTQEEFGKMLGVKRSQVSRLEHGSSITFQTAAKAFKALGISANIVTNNGIQIALA